MVSVKNTRLQYFDVGASFFNATYLAISEQSLDSHQLSALIYIVKPSQHWFPKLFFGNTRLLLFTLQLAVIERMESKKIKKRVNIRKPKMVIAIIASFAPRAWHSTHRGVKFFFPGTPLPNKLLISY